MNTESVSGPRQAELIEYNVIDINALYSTGSSAAQTQVENVCIELRGEAPLHYVLQLFLAVARTALELSYRAHETATATVIYSILDSEKFFRPYGTVLKEWSANELDAFSKAQAQDTATELIFDITEHWSTAAASNADAQLQSFLKQLYLHSPRKQRVTLTGSAPVLPSLFALNWFRSLTTELYYHSEKLK